MLRLLGVVRIYNPSLALDSAYLGLGLVLSLSLSRDG